MKQVMAIKTANHDMPCNGCMKLMEYKMKFGLSPEEELVTQNAWANGWQIKKGNQYIEYGEWRSLPEIHDLLKSLMDLQTMLSPSDFFVASSSDATGQ